MSKVYKVKVNGVSYEVEMEEMTGQPTASASSAPSPSAASTGGGAGGSVNTPMQGVIQEVNTAVGSSVKKGDKLFVLEAMKMFNDINSPQDGVVDQIRVSKGSTVSVGEVLLTFK